MNIDRRDTRGPHIYSIRVHAKLAKVSKCRLCFGTGDFASFDIYARGEYLVVRTLNDTILCVRGCGKFRANSRKRERETRKRQENESTESVEIREGEASLEKRRQKERKKCWERETHLAGAQLDWPFVKDANRPWGHSAGSCSDTTGKQRRKILFS